ncbi:MAG: hypothetical protein HPY66_0453 [Firmicutes bacterium]|nr:hypothetical protein [Bacillota bacterium]
MGELLQRIKGDTYYIKGPVNAGVYIYEDRNCVIIDTGNDDDSGRKIFKTLEGEGLEASSIINTHSHADHFGGNRFLIKRTGAEVMATQIEAAIISNPYLEPFYLFSAHPLKKLQNKFLMGKESRVDRVIEPGVLDLGERTIEIIDLKGHSPGQIGIATPDGVLFTADAFFSSAIVDKYKLPYFTNLRDTIDTLNRLKQTDYEFYLPCHGECITEIKGEVDVNLRAIENTIDMLKQKLTVPMSREEIIALVCSEYGVDLNVSQYYLSQSCISAYLAYLTNEGVLTTIIEDYRMKWVIE